MYPAWGRIEDDLYEQLAAKGHNNVRIFNLAFPAHTSRDSLLKYSALGDSRFDLVVFYHGMNDVRVNNAPPDIFREDYSHYSWYKVINTFASYHGRAYFALPYTLHYLVVGIQGTLGSEQVVPTHIPRGDWVRYGKEPRSTVSFERNLSALLDVAAQRGDRVLLMTFASHVAKDHSREATSQKRRANGLRPDPIEIWGVCEHVAHTVAKHNEIVRRLAAKREDVLFVDQAKLMDGDADCFFDPCHLTDGGCSKFVENMLAVLLPSVPNRQSPLARSPAN